MKNFNKKLLSFAIVLCMFLSCFSGVVFAKDTETIVILYENDVHCAVEGYSKLAAMKNELSEDYEYVGVVSSGDFVQGGTLGAVSRGEYVVSLMNLVGYDAVTLGNHEFDFRQQGLIDMLNNAVASGDTLPPIVCGNYYPPTDGTAEEAWEAYNNYGVKDYIVIEKDGVRFAIFGVIGVDAHSNAPMSGMNFEDPIETAERIVKEIKENEDYVLEIYVNDKLVHTQNGTSPFYGFHTVKLTKEIPVE